MQVRGTNPDLYTGMKKSAKKAKPEPKVGIVGFSVRRRPRPHTSAPRSLAGRRAASHARAYGD